MKTKPVISLIGSAIRVHLWEQLYKDLSKSNNVSFEIIFMGDKIPKFKLPENFRFYFTKVKPAQCLEAVFRKARGKYVCLIADDLIFSKGYLDKLFKVIQKQDDSTIVSGVYYFNNVKQPNYVNGDKTKILPVCGLIKKSLWKSVGGLDRRFIASYADTDLFLRIYKIGGKVILVNSAIANELNVHGEIGLYPSFGAVYDKPFFDSLWTTNKFPPSKFLFEFTRKFVGLDFLPKFKKLRMFFFQSVLTKYLLGISPKRRKSFEPFADKDLLLASQSRKGKWT